MNRRVTTLTDGANVFLSCLLRAAIYCFASGRHGGSSFCRWPRARSYVFHDRVKKTIGAANRNRLGEPLPNIRLERTGSVACER